MAKDAKPRLTVTDETIDEALSAMAGTAAVYAAHGTRTWATTGR